jgi:drug/metabolite transporter (DMT)-like permease
MTYTLSLVAAAGCALCNGVAAILQKMSADNEATVSGLDAGLLLRLVKNTPYVLGLVLDILGWILTFLAVRTLPLFLVESIVAANIAVTALIERFVMHRSLPKKSYVTILVMLVGLVLVSLSAAPETSKVLSGAALWSLFVIPFIVALVAIFVARNSSARAATIVAGLGGISFGLTSVASRVFREAHPFWHNVYNPAIIMLVIAGILGIFLFSVALQRAAATIVNASMTATQTLIPSLIGITVLGDSARHGTWYLVVLGTLITTAAAVALSLQYTPASHPHTS